MRRDWYRLYPTQVAEAAATVLLGVAVQKLPPEAATRGTYPVIETRHRGKITDDQHEAVCCSSFANETYDALVCIAAIYPFEAYRVTIKLVKCWFTPVESV